MILTPKCLQILRSSPKRTDGRKSALQLFILFKTFFFVSQILIVRHRIAYAILQVASDAHVSPSLAFSSALLKTKLDYLPYCGLQISIILLLAGQ